MPFSSPSLRAPPVLAALAAAALLAAAPSPGTAQSRTSSALRGLVVREDGAPLADASVTLRHEPTGRERTVVTTAQGRFLLQLLQPGGPYTLTVTALGFGDVTREGIRLQVGETALVELVARERAIELEGLEVGIERDEIFEPGQVGPATLMDERVVESIPVLSRNVMELAVLSPLVRTTEGGGFSVAGQNDRYNAILVDGVANKDPFGLTAGGVPGAQAGAKLLPLDAVAQYEVLVAPFDVRLGGFTGGVMNAVTRSGTNDWRVRGFGVHRNEAFIGDLNLPTGPVEASGVDRSVFGLSVGGPLVRDRAHIFVTGEVESRHQPPAGYNLDRDDPVLARIAPDVAASVDGALTGLGVEPGLAGPYALRQELANVFARVDWSLGGGHRLTLRDVYAHADNDESPNRAFFDAYELSSNAVFRRSTNNVTSLQLFSDLGGGAANELDVNLQRTTDITTPAVAWPQVEVDLISRLDEGTFRRPLRAGAQFFAQDNDLDQTTLRLTNSLSLDRGDNSFTLGVTGAYYDIAHRYLPASTGDFFFASLADLEANAPQRYQRAQLAEGQDPTVDFSVAEWGAFVQNRIDAGKGLTLRLGIRLDMPVVLDRPPTNPEVLDLFALDTRRVPSGMLMVSPRFGFNWQGEGRLTTQVRGGVGVFVGQLPFVWLSNAYHNDGMRSVTLVCQGRRTDDPLPSRPAPAFTAGAPPASCDGGAPFDEVRTVTVFSDDFRYPQDVRFSATVDQELSSSLSGTLGFLFNKSINQLALREMNLGDPQGDLGSLEGYGGLRRRQFGRASDTGFEPTFDHPEYDQVLLAENESEDWSVSLSAELRGRVGDRVTVQAGYSFARSFDRMSLTFTDMVSNYGFNPIGQDPNRPLVNPSDFDRPHKVVLALFGAPFPGLDDTEVSLLYTGQSGVPFSYVYRGDLNGDGYPGLGPAFDRTNDLLYVPASPSELPAGFGTQALLSRALETDDCLRENRGDLLRRNACRSPWQNRLDVRLAQTLRVGDADLRLEADLINVLNLIDGDLGRVESVPPVVPLLETRRGGGIGGTPPLNASWAGGALPARDGDGGLEVTAPWSVVSPDSQWQAQIGLRVTLGAAR